MAINLQKQGELQRASQEAAGEGLPGATQQTNVEVKRPVQRFSITSENGKIKSIEWGSIVID